MEDVEWWSWRLSAALSQTELRPRFSDPSGWVADLEADLDALDARCAQRRAETPTPAATARFQALFEKKYPLKEHPFMLM